MDQMAAMSPSPRQGTKAFISHDAIRTLIEELAADHRVLGPTVRDGAIVYDDIKALAELPAGWKDRQDAGRYRLERIFPETVVVYAIEGACFDGGAQMTPQVAAAVNEDAEGIIEEVDRLSPVEIVAAAQSSG